MMQSRAVVIGGGLVGSLVAWRLAAAGLRVEVLERAVPGAEASSAAAGILAAQSESATPGVMFDLSMTSIALHATLAAEVREAVGLDVGHRVCGAVETALDDAALAVLRARVAWQRDLGLRAELVDAAGLRAREPSLGEGFVGAAVFPDDAVVDPPRLVNGVAQAATRAGVTFRAGVTVRRVAVKSGRAVGVETDAGLIEADTVVVCAGAWSGLVEGALPRDALVRPARGQVVELATRPVPIGSVVFAHGGYLVPRADGHVYVGSTLEFVGYRREVTVAGMQRILGIATRAVPSLESAAVSRSWSNFRPYTDDRVPLVGTFGVEGLVVATGHHRSGILLAPVTAEIVRDLVAHGRRHPALDALAPDRAVPA